MTRVIGVRFRTAGKIYFFDPLAFEIKRGDHVIVETARGIEFGTVMSGPREVEDDKVIQPLKPVIRIANERDLEQAANNKVKEKDAFRICQEKIRKHELEMKLIDAEYTFDNNKVLFYFTADGRIDFRELVKDLASVFKTRIELRQIGVRDETKIVGGIGICGRPLCCHSYLSDFIPVSIKMAKEQNLSLNPTKISGVCGRLMCCLKNEEETYAELNRKLPGVGDYVTTADGLKGEVQSVNVLRQLVKIVVEEGDEKEIKEYPVEQLQFRRRHGKRDRLELSKEELQELEKLEKEEQQEAAEMGDEGGQRQGSRGRNRQDGEYRRDNRNRSKEGQRRDNRGSQGDSRGNQGDNRFNQGDSRGNQGDNRGNQGDNRFNQGDGRGNQGDSRGNQGDSRGNQGDNRGNQGDNRFNQGDGRGNQGDSRGNQGDSRGNQGDNRFNQGDGRGNQGDNRGSQGDRGRSPGDNRSSQGEYGRGQSERRNSQGERRSPQRDGRNNPAEQGSGEEQRQWNKNRRRNRHNGQQEEQGKRNDDRSEG